MFGPQSLLCIKLAASSHISAALLLMLFVSLAVADNVSSFEMYFKSTTML